MDNKLCLGQNCQTLRDKTKLFCDKCWSKVSDDLKDKMLENYTPGQFVGHSKPNQEWINVAKEAIRSLKK